jgi:hypothetical protein
MKDRVCFVICPIGDDGSEVRADAELLHDFILKPTLSAPPFSMDIRRADKLGEPGIITNQIIREIENADLVVADLSFGNPNVFYEVAIRHVTRKPFVHLIRRGQRIPFDTAHVRAIEFDLKDLRSVDNAKRDLARQAKASLEKGTSESPVSIAATVESLRQSGNVDKIALADILAELSSMRGAVDRLTANQIAAEKRRQIPTGMFGGSAAPTNALAGFLGTDSPALAEYIALKASEMPSPSTTSGSLATSLADLLKPTLEKK